MLTGALRTRCVLQSLSSNPRVFHNVHIAIAFRQPDPQAQFLLRSASTLRSIRKGHHRRLLSKALQSHREPKRPISKISARDRQLQKDEIARTHNRSRLVGSSSQATSIYADRVRLADAVLDKLKAEKLLDALAIVRASNVSIDGDRPIDSTVSWNHIIDWLMLKSDPKQAWQVFNEVYITRNGFFLSLTADFCKDEETRPQARCADIHNIVARLPREFQKAQHCQTGGGCLQFHVCKKCCGQAYHHSHQRCAGRLCESP